MDRCTDRYNGTGTDRMTETDRQIERQTIHILYTTERMIDRQIEWQSDKQRDEKRMTE